MGGFQRIDAAALVDMTGINRAAGTLATAKARHARSIVALEDAERALAEARHRLPAMIESAAAGEVELTPDAVDEAHAAVRRAQQFSTACSAVQVRLHAAQQRAADALADARGRGWEVVMRKGAELRAEAGRLMDRARIERPGGTRAFEVEARERFMAERAEPALELFTEGTRLVELAMGNGSKLPGAKQWLPDFDGVTERRERAHFMQHPEHAAH